MGRASIEGAGALNSSAQALGHNTLVKTNYEKSAEDGEYANTRGIDNKQLLQQQKNMLDNQNKALGQIGETLNVIDYENQNMQGELGM